MASRVWLRVVCGWIVAGLVQVAAAQGLDILGEAEKAASPDLTEDQAAIEARLKRLEEKQGTKTSRVIVLKWPDTAVGHENLILQALVKNRLGRPSAKFYPGIDLYQEGRIRVVDHGIPVRASAQPGRVPDEILEETRGLISRAKRSIRPGEANNQVAGDLVEWVDELWFIDRSEVREALFDLYVTIGSASYYTQNQTPPYFRMVGRQDLNYYLYQAAAMLWEEKDLEDATLASRVPSGPIGGVILDLVNEIEDGQPELLPLAFHEQGFFDAKKFARDYAVYVNGIERTIDDSGLIYVPRGRIDIYLERNSDGMSMSERLEVSRLDEKVYFVMETARQKMGFSLLNTLMMDPASCARLLDARTRSSLAAYAALHPNDEVYLVVPRAGSYHDLFIWRYTQGKRGEADYLLLMQDRNGGFPVRFVLLSATGTIFNNATVSTEAFTNIATADNAAAGEPPTLPDASAVDFNLAAVPIDFQFRAHFNRFMFGFGAHMASNVAPPEEGATAENEGKWTEYYQTKRGSNHIVIEQADPTQIDPGGGDKIAFNVQEWQRLLYVHLGVMLLKDAPFGMGPRGYLRFGWYNLPNAFDLTGHIGITEEPTFGKKEYKGRVVPILDADLYAGMMIPFGRSLQCQDYVNGRCRPRILPVLGVTLGAGFTF